MSPAHRLEAAADEVFAAHRAVAPYRPGSAPARERAYLRALEAYFQASELAAGRDPARDDEGDEPADEERVERRTRQQWAVDAHYAAARRALRLARAYQGEPDTSGRREAECVTAVQAHRAAVRALRREMRGERAPEAAPPARPGLAKTRPSVAPGAREVAS